jgi:RimJ/RimL family protein N-acetyltransferase
MTRYFRKLTGEKVYLSPVCVEDAETFMAWINDAEVAVNMFFLQKIIDVTKERQALQKLAEEGDHFAIIDAQKDQLIGMGGFFNTNASMQTADVGIFIGDKTYWGQGYGTEALTLILDFGFNVRNYHNVGLQVKEFNQRAIRSYQKIGFKTIGVRREVEPLGGTRYGHVYMDLLASEFAAKGISRILKGVLP